MKKIIFFLTAVLLLAGCGGDNPAGNVLASFEGGLLTSEDVRAHYRALKKQDRFRNRPELLTPEFVFDHALNMEMIIAEGLQRELHHDPYIRQKLHNRMSSLFLKILEDDLVEKIDRDGISEEEMRRFYEENKGNYLKPALYTISAFEVDPGRAEKVMAEIDGGLDFAEAASQYALNEEERLNGGRTGRRSLRRFQPEWQPQVRALKEGEPAGPLKIKDKFYIMLLENRTEPYQYSFKEKEAYIRNDVLYDRYREAWQRVYDRLRREFEVKINRENLEAFYRQPVTEDREG